jgi:hemolysin III
VNETFVIQDPESGKRHQTMGEEIANSVSHGVGLVAALIGIPFLIAHARRLGETDFMVGCGVFGATIIILYLTSTLYHALPRGRVKHFFRTVEHMAIFLLIAGTYTPFTLGVLEGPWGWTLLGLIWTLTLAGVMLKLLRGAEAHPILSTSLYLLMGWVVLIAVRPLWLHMPHVGFLWIFLGGLAYSGGVIFYAIDYRMRYSHFIWHLFVLAGTILHFFAVFWYAA